VVDGGADHGLMTTVNAIEDADGEEDRAR